jgi:hypothetical protein
MCIFKTMQDFDFSLIQNITLGFLTLLIPFVILFIQDFKQKFKGMFGKQIFMKIFGEWGWKIIFLFVVGVLFPVWFDKTNVLLPIWYVYLLSISLCIVGVQIFLVIYKLTFISKERKNLWEKLIEDEKETEDIKDFFEDYWSNDEVGSENDSVVWDKFKDKVNLFFDNNQYKEISEMLRVFWGNFDKRNNYIWQSLKFIKQIFDWRLKTWDWFKAENTDGGLMDVDDILSTISIGLLEKAITGKHQLFSFLKGVREHFDENIDIDEMGRDGYSGRVFAGNFLPKLWKEIGKQEQDYSLQQYFPHEWKWWNKEYQLNGWIRATALNYWKKNTSDTKVLSLLLDKNYNTEELGRYFFLVCHGTLIIPKEVDDVSIRHFFEEEEKANYPWDSGIVRLGNLEESEEERSKALRELREGKRKGTLRVILDNPLQNTIPFGEHSNWICKNLDLVIEKFNSSEVEKITKEKEYWEYNRTKFVKLLKDLKDIKEQQEKNKDIN